jgi:hypothetical protein
MTSANFGAGGGAKNRNISPHARPSPPVYSNKDLISNTSKFLFNVNFDRGNG